jgi:hypothetical protein
VVWVVFKRRERRVEIQISLDWRMVYIVSFSIMQKDIEILSKLTAEEQISILEIISRSASDLSPIEIDDVVYQIPDTVHDLIDNLALQIKELSTLDGDISKPN